jgi:hypothetical protein
MSDKNLEQRRNIKFYVKIDKKVNETSAMKKLSVFEWHRRFKEGREGVQDHYCMSSLFFALCAKNARKLRY